MAVTHRASRWLHPDRYSSHALGVPQGRRGVPWVEIGVKWGLPRGFISLRRAVVSDELPLQHVYADALSKSSWVILHGERLTCCSSHGDSDWTAVVNQVGQLHRAHCSSVGQYECCNGDCCSSLGPWVWVPCHTAGQSQLRL